MDNASTPQTLLSTDGHPSPAAPGSRSPRYLLLVAGAFLAGFAALSVDVPVAKWCAAGNCPGDLKKIFHLAETFAHGIGVAIILLAMFLLDPVRRWMMPRLVVMTISAGLCANLIKLTIARARPRAFDLELGVWDSFAGWLPLTEAGSAGQSLPSAHTTTAFAFAIGLAWAYPRGRWLFATLAVLAACQRVVAEAHFLSDICWGAALGSLIGCGFVRGWLSPKWLDRWEASLARRLATKWEPLEDGTGRCLDDPATDEQRRAA